MWRWLVLLVLFALTALGPARAAPGCSEPPATWPRLAAGPGGLWWVPAEHGDADAGNRGQVSNLLIVPDGARLWLIGSGPSPAFGRRLACAIDAQFGRPVTDIVSPWAHPEAVLGLAAWPEARWWAHADVAAEMRQRCPICVARLRQRLGDAATDLGDDPVRVPTRLFEGREGTLGPLRWWRLSRGEGFPVTVWWHPPSGAAFAPGLLWGAAAPDGRDADLDAMALSTAALSRWPATQWLGEQGGWHEAQAPAVAAAYWSALRRAASDGLERGDTGLAAPTALPGVPAALTDAPAHALNWQRAWRQSEERWLQRSLR